jgi:polar amino acid transport system substrate-binding protein
LAPTGKLRVALLADNPVTASRDARTGEMTGVAVDLTKELARRLNVQSELVVYPTVARLIESAAEDQWDVTFIGINPDRAKYIRFAGAYAEVEMGYLVPNGSPLMTNSDVDKSTIRVAVQAKGGADILLSKQLKNATLVRAPTISGCIELLKAEKADVIAAVKTFLYPASDQLTGSRVLDGRVSVTSIGIGVPPNREKSAVFTRRFIENAKSSGFVQKALARAGLRGVVVAKAE